LNSVPATLCALPDVVYIGSSSGVVDGRAEAFERRAGASFGVVGATPWARRVSGERSGQWPPPGVTHTRAAGARRTGLAGDEARVKNRRVVGEGGCQAVRDPSGAGRDGRVRA
jgi:hypothetical protein